jgi:hypothetical protein
MQLIPRRTLSGSLAIKQPNDAGVLALSRDALPDIDAYGPPTILFQSGTVPEME